MERDEKGFSLVELIIVIAIMAILVGIVGSQVLPYLNKSREAKDQQILSAWVTAATSSYASNATELIDESYDIVIDSSDVVVDGTNGTRLKNDFVGFSGVDVSSPLSCFSSKLYSEIDRITFTVSTETNGEKNTVCICKIEGVTSGSIYTSELVSQ